MSELENPGTIGSQLHDRFTRGIPLSVDEQAQLEAWYTREDQAEGDILVATASVPDVDALQAQLDKSLEEVHTVVQRIRQLVSDNEATRREIETLQHQLVQSRPTQPA